MNRILKRQLKRHFSKEFDPTSLDENVQSLLESVSQSYDEFAKEKRLLENTLELNSEELFAANKKVLEQNREIDTELQQYKHAMESAMLVNRFNLDGTLSFVNEKFCIMSGKDESYFLGKEHCSLYHDNPHAKAMKQKIFAKETWSGTLKHKAKNGEVFVLNATIFPILNADNEITCFMSIYQDITEIEKSRIKALELDKSKSLFIANMSHELRTPLNSIIGFSQILKKQEKIPEKLRGFIERINVSGEHLLKLINSILDFSKIEAGQVQLEKIEINLYEIANSVMTQQEPQAREKGLSLRVLYDEQMPKYFLGDSLRLTQILTNLVSNALKFTEHGGVSIIVSYKAENRVRCEVKDTGIGLSEKAKEKLFKQFSQADESTTREYGGTGLGLSISKELVTLMGGKIWVESEEHKGSSFIFEINLEDAKHADPLFEDDNSEEHKASVQDLKHFTEKKILLAEDNVTNQFLVEAMLDETDIQLDIANNGLEALNLFHAHTEEYYSLILMDLQMPIMNGFEATERIRKTNQTIPILGLSANIDKEDIAKAKVLGMNNYLSKPIDSEKFFRTLLKYLNESKF